MTAEATYPIPQERGALLKLAGTLLMIRANHIDAGLETAEIDAYLRALVQAGA